MKPMNVHIIGATGRSGVALCRSLAADGVQYVPVVRNAAKWQATGLPASPRLADLRSPRTLRKALKEAQVVVSCAHARHAADILDAAPSDVGHFVFLGSTRKFTRWPDAHGLGVLAGEAAFRGSSRVGVMLHPTMIYGAEGEDNVQRLARLLARMPLVPLPGGGQAFVRPIYQGDVTRSLRAAIDTIWHRPETLVLAGGDRLTYADFVRAVARAAGLPPPRIVPLSAGLLRFAAPLTRVVPGIPTIRRAEVQRLLEDKSWGIEPMNRQLGIIPIALADGLARTFAVSTAKVA
nr:NAD(P)H-binding protein [Acidisphaera sp. L21]